MVVRRERWTKRIVSWGTSEAERGLTFACDDVLEAADQALFRAVTVEAPAPVVFRWLCQLKAAPYSYDLIDNRGSRSPRRLTPGLKVLTIGEPVMTIFRLVDFADGVHLTIQLEHHRLFGDIAATYLVVPLDRSRSRLIVKLLVVYPRSVAGRLVRSTLPAGDLIMMRRQLRTLKRLAETAPTPVQHRQG